MLGEAWLLVAKEDLKASTEEFKKAQARQLKMLDRMRDFTSHEFELELQLHKPEPEPAIQEASWGELEQLQERVKRRLAGALDTPPAQASPCA